jgi:hypothetical protein
MDPLLGALQRVVEAHIHKESGSINRKVKASHKEMANLMRGANNWNNQPLWDVTILDVVIQKILELCANLANVILVHFPVKTCFCFLPFDGGCEIH